LLNAPSGITGISVTPNKPSRTIVAEYSGMPASGAVLDLCGTVNNQTSAVTSWFSTATTTTASDLVFGIADTKSTGNGGYQATGLWTGRLVQHDTVDADDSFVEDQINVASGVYTATGTTTISVDESSVVVAFKANLGPVSPKITSANSATFAVGSVGTFAVTATGTTPIIFTETGALPSPVVLSSTGVLSGTPATGTAGTYPITITAANGTLPNATQNFTLTVGQAPAITSANSTTFTVGAAGTFAITATGTPAPTFTETGALPSGVTLATTGVLSGTPAAGTGGTYTFTVTAQNGATPNATQSFTLTVNQAAAITSAASTTFTIGTAGTFTVTATGFPVPTIIESGTLPSLVAFNNGVLSGTPAAGTAGGYPISFTASNGVGAPVTQNFTLNVNSVPVAGPIAFVRAAGNTGESVKYTVSITPTAGDFLGVFVFQIEAAATPAAMTDNLGTVYTKDCDLTYNQGSGVRRLTVYHLLNAPSGITGISVTPNKPSRTIVAEYSGMPASGAVLDLCGTVNNQTSAVTSWTSTATTTTATDVVFGIADTKSSGNAGYNASGLWTGRLAEHDTVDADDSYLEDQVAVPAGVYTATGTSTVSVDESSVVVAFRTIAAPPSLTSVAVSPTSVVGGSPSTGTVTLNAAAATGGTTVTLTDNNAAASEATSLTVPAGATTATFPIATTPVGASVSVTVSGTLGTVTKTATLTVNPPALSTVSVSPTSVKGGTSSTGTVTLTGAAPAAGTVVTLTDNNAAASEPASVTVPAGATTATFTITTTTVTSSRSVRISGSLNGTTKNATLTVTP